MQEWDGGDSPGVRDVFDFPTEEPSELFVNPFACAIDPFMWRELQVRGARYTSRHEHPRQWWTVKPALCRLGLMPG